jgi:acetate kinase
LDVAGLMTPPKRDVILAINCGSSSLKVAAFATNPLTQLSAVNVEMSARAIDDALSRLSADGVPPPTVAGHRVVHGGAKYTAPTRIDDRVLAELNELVPLAPVHLPLSIAAIEALTQRHPQLPQVACFDTAFHATMPEIAWRLPLPALDGGIRRYGFHGLSYEYVMSTLGATPPSRIVIAHLGNGSSLVAVKDGRAIDTTMGLTPAGGVMMGSRTGDLDPGVLTYLMRARKLSADQLERLVNEQSGMRAIGGTSDMRALLERSAADPSARLAVSMFAYSVRKAIGALVAALGGIDLLVFTGGIGENAAAVREEVCAALGDVIARAEVRVVRTDEDLMVARHAVRCASS